MNIFSGFVSIKEAGSPLLSMNYVQLHSKSVAARDDDRRQGPAFDNQRPCSNSPSLHAPLPLSFPFSLPSIPPFPFFPFPFSPSPAPPNAS